MNTRILQFPLAALALLGMISCNIQESSSEPSSVALAPRFAAGTTVPSTVCVSIRFQTESGIDSTRTIPYAPGGPITLGSLPPSTPFKLTMTGYDTTITGDTVAIWWTTKSDTSGGDATRTILLPTPLQSMPISRIFPLSDTVSYQGKTLKIPAGARVTKDGTDPRTNPNAITVGMSAEYLADSVPLLRAAVMIRAGYESESPLLWSLVQDYKLVIDPLDTLTSLDTLFLTTWRFWADSIDQKADTNDIFHSDSINASGVLQAPFNPDDSARTDTLDAFFGDDPLSVKLHCYVVPSSPRATIRVSGQLTPPDSFVKTPLPPDSTLKVVVENHGHTRTYTVHFVASKAAFVPKHLDSLKTPSPGLKQDPTDNTKFMIELPAGQDTLKLQPFVSPGCSTRIGSQILPSGETASIHVGSDTATIQLDVFSDRTDIVSLEIVVRISHTLPIAFRDTTNGIPWRSVAYDTLQYGTRNYRTIVVGTARWMAENLNFKIDSSFCAGTTVEACAKYGRLYTWSGAADTTAHFDSAGLTFTGDLQGVCPVGWHLPSSAEWQSLIDVLGSSRAAALLQSYGTSWIPAVGQDSLGMRILPAGHRTITVDHPHYYIAGQNSEAWFWTSTQGPSQNQANAFRISSNTGLASFVPGHAKEEALSVRCVSDTAVVAP